MRSALAVAAVALALLTGAQSCLVLGEGADGGTNIDPGPLQAGSLGVVSAALILLGGGTIRRPNISMWLFLAAGLLCLAIAATSSFRTLALWGVLSGVAAALSYMLSQNSRP